MLEHYQDSSCTLILGDTVDVGSTLGAWLVENRKAEQVVEIEIPKEATDALKHGAEVIQKAEAELKQIEHANKKRGRQ